LPPSSINSAFASLVFSHPLLFSTACLLPLLAFPPWARNASASRLLRPKTLVTRNTQRRSSPLSPRGLRLPSLCVSRLMIQTTPRGSRRRSGLTSGPSSARGLAGSDESEYSSDEEDSSEEDSGGGGEGDDDDDDGGDGGDDDGDGGVGGSRGGNGSSRGGSSGGRGGNKASG
jgi:hypothetical protein